jgi:NAD(P)-dependent dehydrogenase (short-subunit alcohol dehydrogenase family)
MNGSAMVAGAGSGIGAALVDRLRQDGQRVLALVRRPVSSVDPDVEWLDVDLARGGVDRVGARLAALDGGLTTLVIAIGALAQAGRAPEKSLAQVEPEPLLDAYRANAVVPLAVLRACAPWLDGERQTVVCVLSARVGSVGDNHLGGWYAYRMAKAALNMGVRTAAIELGRRRNPPIVFAVHPGTTRTPLSNRFLRGGRAAATAAETADRLATLLRVVDRRAHGQLLDWDGTVLPW